MIAGIPILQMTKHTMSYHMLTEGLQLKYGKYNKVQFLRKQELLSPSVCDHFTNGSNTDSNVNQIWKAHLPWVQGRTRRRGCCCIFCWQWGTLHSFWHWHLAALLPDSVSWLKEKDVNIQATRNMLVWHCSLWNVIVMSVPDCIIIAVLCNLSVPLPSSMAPFSR